MLVGWGGGRYRCCTPSDAPVFQALTCPPVSSRPPSSSSIQPPVALLQPPAAGITRTHSHACQGPSQQEYAYQSRILSVMPGRFFRQIWDGLERCWEDFESLRREAGGTGTVGGGFIHGEDVERFVSGWQVFIFERSNVIREALKQRMVAQTNGSPDSNATRRCRVVLPRVIAILKRHLAISSSGLFTHDAGLIGDGRFFATILLAQGDLDQDTDNDLKGEDELPWDVDIEEGVDACLSALGWIFANSHDREKMVHMRDYLEGQRAQAYHSGQLPPRTRAKDRSSKNMPASRIQPPSSLIQCSASNRPPHPASSCPPSSSFPSPKRALSVLQQPPVTQLSFSDNAKPLSPPPAATRTRDRHQRQC
ncbi:hypothetical protein M405DRAFT_866094 [Rhizopogon salebrosus TDB-379]|nr:hypothetical protein M405DRAFT_866094 [Rhizopogon salebrosus TDB-379]